MIIELKRHSFAADIHLIEWYDHWIVMAILSSSGTYIGTGAAEKVIPVSKHILGTMAGGAADCSFWLRHLAMQVRHLPYLIAP